MEAEADKAYVTSKKKWSDFDLHPELIEVLKMNKMTRPTRVQDETLEITANPDRKKFSLLIRSSNGSGKTLCYLLPILNSLKQGITTAKDKTVGGKTFKNQIFTPQAIIFVQTGMLAQQIQLILQQFLKLAVSMAESENKKLQLMNYTIGMMNGDKHTPGDIVISVIKSFINRSERKNISLSNCNFAAFDQVDEIFQSGSQLLKKAFDIIRDDSKTKLLVCSATMKKQFLAFYHQNIPKSPNALQININDILKKQLGHNISLEGVSNYICISGPADRHNYIINEIFKELYKNKDKMKPKVFIFFNSIVEIQRFNAAFDQASTDLTSDTHQYLQGVRLGIVSAKRKINGEDKQLKHEQRADILNKFRNGDFHILLATNIIARGIDIRDVCFVINCDAPREKGGDKAKGQDGVISIDTYLHRVGRTGRYSDKGIALTIVPGQKDKKYLVQSVQKVHKVSIKDIVSVSALHEQILKCIAFNTNTQNQKK